jgi:branched-chain amino acid transport system substrate-binding protein
MASWDWGHRYWLRSAHSAGASRHPARGLPSLLHRRLANRRTADPLTKEIGSMHTRASRLGAAVAVLAASALLLSACGRSSSGGGASVPASSPGITNTSVKIGVTFPLSGPAGAIFQPMAAAMRAWAASINATGGVRMGDGKTRKLVLDFLDDQDDPAQAVQNAQQLIQQDQVFALCCSAGTPIITAVNGVAAKAGVPQVFTLGDSALFTDSKYPDTWTSGPPTSLDGYAWTKWLQANKPGSKIGLLTDTSDFGQGLVKSIQDLTATGSVKLTKVETYQPTDTTVASQIDDLKASGANVLWVAASDPVHQVEALQAAEQIGWHPTRIVSFNADGKNNVLDPLGLSNAKGMYSGAFTYDPSDPAGAAALTSWIATMKKYAPSLDTTSLYNLLACTGLDALVNLLKITKAPTRAALLKAASSGAKINAVGLLPGIYYTRGANSQFGIQTLQLRQYTGSSWVNLGGPVTAPSSALAVFN